MIIRFAPRLLLAMLLIGVSAPAVAQDLNQPLPIDPKVTVGKLDNGLRYMIRANPRPEKRAQLRLVVDAGSVQEDDDQLGLAHLLEHMAFNGSKNFEKQELVKYMESIGMRLGPHINAYTSFDETVYMLQIPTDTAEVMAKAFQILEDWAHQLTLDPAEIDKERGVVIEEWRLGRGAGARILDRQLPVLFRGSKYAERLPIGKREVLEGAPPAAIRRFYHDWYRPDLMTVIAVGDFDPATIEGKIRDHFNRVPARPNPRARTLVDIPEHTETLFAIESDPEQTNTTVAVLYKQPLRDQSTFIAYRRLIVESLFNQMLNARLFELAQQPEPPLLFGFSGQGGFVRSSEVYQLFAGVDETGVRKGLEALLTEGERVDRHGFTATELDRAKAELLRNMERNFAEREKRESESYADEYVRHALEGEPIPGIELEYQMWQAFLPTVPLEEVNDLAREWLVDRNRVVLVDAPQKPGLALPSAADLRSVFTTVVASDIEPYEDAVVEAPLVANVPAGSPVTNEERVAEIGLTVWTLGNGVRVLLKPTDFKDDELLFRAYSPGGSSLAPDRDYDAVFLAEAAVMQGGVGDYSIIDLQKALAGKAVQVAPTIQPHFEGMSGQASPKDMETLFELIYAYFTAPRKDSAAFQAFQAQAQGFLANRAASPRQAFADTVAVTMAQGHPRAKPISAELFARLDLNKSIEFYRQRFADASDFTFVFVGAFSPEQIRPLVETYLGGLPSIKRQESWRDVGIRAPRGVIKKTVRKGVEPQSQTQIIFTGDFSYTPENRHIVRSLASALQTRLRDRLREDLGGTYSVGVSGTYDKDPVPGYSMRIAFGSAPERVEELTGVVFEEIAKFKTEGPTQAEVTGVREEQRRARETDLKENGYWAAQLYFADMYKQDPRFLLDMSFMEGLTAEKIRAAAAQYFDLQNYVQVSLFPENQVP